MAILLATIGCFAPLYSVQALFPAIADRFDAGVSFAAALVTVCTAGLAVFSPIAGRICAGVGVRRAVQFAIAGLIATNLAMSVVESASLLMLLRVMQGCLIPVGLAALLASLGSLWRESGAVGLAATYTTGVVIGGLLGRFLPAALMAYGWSAAFIGFAVFQAALMIVALRLFPTDESGRVISFEPLGAWLKSVWRVARDEVPTVAIGGFVLMATQVSITTFVSVRLAGPPFEWPPLALGALYLVFVPSIAAVRVTPPAIQRMGARKTLLVCALVMWASLALTLWDSAWLILVGITLFSACVFVAQTVLAHALSGAREENRERASSGYLAAVYAGASVGALAPAASWQMWGWPGCLGTVAAIQFAGLILALLSTKWSTEVSPL